MILYNLLITTKHPTSTIKSSLTKCTYYFSVKHLEPVYTEPATTMTTWRKKHNFSSDCLFYKITWSSLKQPLFLLAAMHSLELRFL